MGFVIKMEKKELIDRLRKCTSTVDVYKLKDEILRHLEGRADRPVKKSPKEDE